MYVGVILLPTVLVVGCTCIPHVCGGDPHQNTQSDATKLVFPMYVGVILAVPNANNNHARIPHVCGGDPELG